MEEGVHKDVLRAMSEHGDCLMVQRHGLTALRLMAEKGMQYAYPEDARASMFLKRLWCADCNISALVDANTSGLVSAAMRRYAADDALQVCGGLQSFSAGRGALYSHGVQPGGRARHTSAS